MVIHFNYNQIYCHSTDFFVFQDDYDDKDKDTFMIANFGTKLVRFVASKKKGYRVPGQGAHAAKITRSLGMPFRHSIYIMTWVGFSWNL